jgi:hypothetical protein
VLIEDELLTGGVPAKVAARVQWLLDTPSLLLAEKDKRLADKEELLATTKTLLARNEELHDQHSAKITAQLSSYQAQLEPRVMCDLLYEALCALKVDKMKLLADEGGNAPPQNKWGVLLRNVVNRDTNGKLLSLSTRAKAALEDVGGSTEANTVLRDMTDISQRLSYAHHNGVVTLGGTGWRVGGPPSPSMAAAVVIAVNADECARKGGGKVLSGETLYIDNNYLPKFELAYDADGLPPLTYRWRP